MKILYLCEGDAEGWSAWSGSAKSLVDHLRADGQVVTCGDADLRGTARLAGAAAPLSATASTENERQGASPRPRNSG